MIEFLISIINRTKQRREKVRFVFIVAVSTNFVLILTSSFTQLIRPIRPIRHIRPTRPSYLVSTELFSYNK